MATVERAEMKTVATGIIAATEITAVTGTTVATEITTDTGTRAAAATADTPAVAGGPGINGQVALIASIVILFVIGFSPKNRKS